MKIYFKLVLLVAGLQMCASVADQGYNLSVRTFECMGECPVYRVSIDSMRNMTFEGLMNTKTGVSTHRITKAEYRDLVEKLDRVWEMESTEIEAGLVDSSNKEFVISTKEGKKVITINNSKPQMDNLNSILNKILSSRGLLEN